MWPLRIGWGEPEVLQRRGGKINLVLSRILLDPTILQSFGSEEEALRALISYEFLVEFNSHLGIEQELSPEAYKYMQAKYTGVNFTYHADFIAFDLGYVAEMASKVFSRLQSVDQLAPMVWDPHEAKIFASDVGRLSYLAIPKGRTRSTRNLVYGAKPLSVIHTLAEAASRSYECPAAAQAFTVVRIRLLSSRSIAN